MAEPIDGTTERAGAALLVMAKQPQAGTTKTRLVPAGSAEYTAALYEAFLLDSLALARGVAGVVPLIAVSPPGSVRYFASLAPDLDQIEQLGSSLPERLDHVLTICLDNGFDSVVAINSDSPTLPAEYVGDAFDRLAEDAVDVVLGPCEDGGYYLIGWKQPHPELIREVTMSTPEVLSDTLAIATRLGLRVVLLPTWYDVDEPADLDRLKKELAADDRLAPHTRAFIEQHPQK